MNEKEEPVAELSRIKKQLDPPSRLEDDIVAALLDRGLLHKRSHAWVKAVAAVVIFGLGIGSGKFIWNTKPIQYTHILFLKEDPARFEAIGHEGSLVQEYSEWARNTTQKGTNVAGEKLEPGGNLVSDKTVAGTKSNEAIAGFFLVQANSDQAALEIAQHCPHLRHGGTIELRRIDPTAR